MIRKILMKPCTDPDYVTELEFQRSTGCVEGIHDGAADSFKPA